MQRCLTSAFTLQMLEEDCCVLVKALNEKELIQLVLEQGDSGPRLSCAVVVGHIDTAAVLTRILGLQVDADKRLVKIVPGDDLVVAQPTGRIIRNVGEVEEPELVFFHCRILDRHGRPVRVKKLKVKKGSTDGVTKPERKSLLGRSNKPKPPKEEINPLWA